MANYSIYVVVVDEDYPVPEPDGSTEQGWQAGWHHIGDTDDYEFADRIAGIIAVKASEGFPTSGG